MIGIGHEQFDVQFMRVLALPFLLFLFASPSSAQVPSSFSASAPDSLRHRRNVCPFECCQYGKWTARNEIPVYADERVSTHIVASISTGERFDARAGNVFMERFGEVDVINPFTLASEKTQYQRGDTLFLLDYLGEGIYNVWTGDKLAEDGDFFVSPEDAVGIPTKYLRGVLRVTPLQRWWVRVRLQDGTDGWIDMDEARVGGADACG